MRREGYFNTGLGRIGFDDEGDVTGVDSFVWYVGKRDTDLPVDPDGLAK